MSSVVIEDSPGSSFAPTLRGEEQDWDDTAYFEYITVRAIVKRDWKYIKRMFGEPSELYDLRNDPEENSNLFGDARYAEITLQLDGELDQFFLQTANEKYDPWRGGAGKAVQMYSDKNDQFESGFPGWHLPEVETLTPFSDLSK